MTRNDFENLKNTKNSILGDDNLGKFSSWAIWEKKNINEFIEKNVDKLKGNIVFVGLNFGKEVEPWEDWQNFYGVERLIDLLSGTDFEGAYMTDIIKNYHEPDSGKALKYLKKHKKIIEENIIFFFEEIALLKAPNIEMYLFGGGVEYIFKKYVMKHKNFDSFQKKVIKCQRISHYSWRVPNFEEIAPVQLGIPKPKKTTGKVRTYKPLWPKNGKR
jgi:hypothetical protein